MRRTNLARQDFNVCQFCLAGLSNPYNARHSFISVGRPRTFTRQSSGHALAYSDEYTNKTDSTVTRTGRGYGKFYAGKVDAAKHDANTPRQSRSTQGWTFRRHPVDSGTEPIDQKIGQYRPKSNTGLNTDREHVGGDLKGQRREGRFEGSELRFDSQNFRDRQNRSVNNQNERWLGPHNARSNYGSGTFRRHSRHHFEDRPTAGTTQDPIANTKHPASNRAEDTIPYEADGTFDAPDAYSVEAEVLFPRRRSQPGSQDRLGSQPRGLSRKKEKKGAATRRSEKFELSDEAPTLSQEQIDKFNRDKKRRERAEKRGPARPIPIELPHFISVTNLATALRVPMEGFLERLIDLGFEDVTGDHVLDAENAALVTGEYGFEPVIDTSDKDYLTAQPYPTNLNSLPPRPPVVTIMGHVDHGKTTLLDYLRQSSIAASEHGGITQHIGAFVVAMSSGKQITFLDTPGHAAFLNMRQRGALVTDLVVLVVAADDSVKPQTVEAIKHSKSANVPIIVAITKVDKDGVDVQRVKTDLVQYGIEVEDYGGDVQAIEVSAKSGHGMDDLEEAIGALTEVLDARADESGRVEGWVLEASTKLQGRVATILVRRGTLRPGKVVVAGKTWARIRTMKNEAGVAVAEATPGIPVEVDGWRDQPIAGDEVLEAENEQRATSVIEFREARDQREQAGKDMEIINENRKAETERREREKEAAAATNREEDVTDGADEAGKAPAEGLHAKPKVTDLCFIVKADVSGSSEAVTGALESLPLGNHPVSIKIIHTGIGHINESDVDRIATVPIGKGFIVSFNQNVPPDIQRQADRSQVRILNESIIYKIIDAVTVVVEEHLPPLITTRVVGEAEIAQVFEMRGSKKKSYTVAGCKVRNGSVTRGGNVMVFRGAEPGVQGELVYKGKVDELKSHKKDVSEMRKGTECGLRFDNWSDFQAGDILQCFEESSEKRKLSSVR